MNRKKNNNKPRRSKPNEAGNGEDILKFKEEAANQSATGAGRPAQLKVEMQTLCLSRNSENAILETLKQLHGSNFSLKDRSSYKDQGENLSNQYWVDRGRLVVQGGIDYSANCNKKTNVAQERVNMFALSKLESYGFHKNHCQESLELTEGNVGKAMEVLLSQYFKLGLSFPFLKGSEPSTEEERSTPDDLLEQRMEEKCVLESIYESAFEERIANQLWVITLEADYLLELFHERKHEAHDNRPSKKQQPEFCRFFAKGSCRYAQLCKFSHQVPEVQNQQETMTEKHKFQLEFRFREDTLYPAEPVLVFISTTDHSFPAEARLRLTQRLLHEAKLCALDEVPAVYTVAQLLVDHPDEMKKIALDKGQSFLDPNVPLLPDNFSANDDSDNCNIEDTERSTVQLEIKQRLKADARQLLNEDLNIARKFQERQKNSRYQKMLGVRKDLPAWEKQDIIVEAVKSNQVVVISGQTGCGKSTQVPQFLMDEWLRSLISSSDKKHIEIVCTQPRRLSAVGVAERVAEERAEAIGNTVGYQIRLESKVSSLTRLLFCTTGILLRRLESEPQLSTVSHIIVDEVHERSEESDFLLLILRDLMAVRPDLKIILMSATLNAHLFSDYFGKAHVIEIPGRTFPVETFFLEDILDATNYALEENSTYAREMKKGGISTEDIESLEVELEMADIQLSTTVIANPATRDQHLTLTQLFHRYKDYSKQTSKNLYLMNPEKINYDLIEAVLVWIVSGYHTFPQQGSILVFLPGMQDISTLHDQLMDHPTLSPRSGKFIILPLHSTLSNEEQTAVFRKPKPGVRKIVLSTNIAETSVTIDDCVYVIDCGRMKEKRFDSNKNMESLELVWVSRANALQRRGRAGRVMPGVCVHLFTKHHFDYHLLAQPVPELHRVPLEQLLLRIKTLDAFRGDDAHHVLARTLEPPPDENIDSALIRLQDVGALDCEKNLTPLGRHLAALPVDVRVGKLMLFGAIFCCIDSALTIAAFLSYRSPFVTPFGKKEQAQLRKKEFAMANSDQLTVLKAYKSWLKAGAHSHYAGQVFATENFLSWRTLQMLADIKRQFLELLVSIGFVQINLGPKRSGTDNILSLTGEQLNVNGENSQLLAAILCAALYPNVVKVLTPEKSFNPSAAGAVPKELRADELRFKTRDDGYVFLHPSSVNYSVSHYRSPYLVYQEKVKTSRVFIRDCSMVPVLPLILFSGCSLNVELHQGTFVISLDDGWIKFTVNTHKVAELLQTIRSELVDLLKEKIEDPGLNLATYKRGRIIISTIIHLITYE